METLPQYLQHAAQRYGDKRVAMRKKQLGIWREFSWHESYTRVKHLALGLMQLGLAHGDKVCIIGDNDPEYFWAQLAVQSCGGIAVGIFTDSIPNEIQYIVQHSDAVIVFAKDQEQCDKMLEIRANVPAIRRVIYWEERGLWNYRDDWLMSFESLIAVGREIDQRAPT
jgi:long-chain acyl-CoA synthetase